MGKMQNVGTKSAFTYFFLMTRAGLNLGILFLG